MLSTVSSIPFELNSSYYTTVTGNNGLDALSVIESRNATDLYMLPPYIRNTSMITCIIVMVLGIIGNLMVPIVVFRGKDMRNSTNIFLVNLSVADLCVLLICTPTILVEVNSGPEIWPLGEHMCKAVPFVELTVAHASVLTILAISFERYYAICEPLRVGPIIWVSQYQEMRIKENRKDHDARNLVPVCLTTVDTNASMIFFLLLVLLFYLAPLIILLILYTFIIRQLMPDSNNISDSYHIKTKKHVIIMLLTVVISFFICLSPYRILIFYIVISPDSAIDPILYNLMSSKFRKQFFKLCKMKKCKSKEMRNNVTYLHECCNYLSIIIVCAKFILLKFIPLSNLQSNDNLS